jgi:Domain of unknown function (DUF3291)
MARVAFTTFAIMREKAGHPQVQGFLDRIQATFAAAHTFPGYLGSPESTGQDYLAPTFFDPATHAEEASTLSLWSDLHAVWAFAYSGLHADALRQRSAWFLKPAWPSYAAWWVADDHMPTWPEAAQRLQHLHEHGPTSFAFTFKQPFDVEGRPLTPRDVTSPASSTEATP